MTALLEDRTLVTYENRNAVYESEPQAKVLALLKVLSEHEPGEGLVPWEKLRGYAFAVPFTMKELALATGRYDDIEPLLATTLINLSGLDWVEITPSGIRLLATTADMKSWNNHFEDRCQLARGLFFSGN